MFYSASFCIYTRIAIGLVADCEVCVCYAKKSRAAESALGVRRTTCCTPNPLFRGWIVLCPPSEFFKELRLVKKTGSDQRRSEASLIFLKVTFLFYQYRTRDKLRDIQAAGRECESERTVCLCLFFPTSGSDGVCVEKKLRRDLSPFLDAIIDGLTAQPER